VSQATVHDIPRGDSIAATRAVQLQQRDFRCMFWMSSRNDMVSSDAGLADGCGAGVVGFVFFVKLADIEETHMFTSNPFAELSAFLPPVFMQVYVVLMVLAVVIGTLIDMLHKGSARYFLRDWRNKRAAARRRLGFWKTAWLALQTLLYEVAAAGELHACSVARQLSHVLMFYGFLAYLIATVVMVFGYPTADVPTPAVWPVLWNLGALALLIGGGWFFLFLRVNVAFEGASRWRLVRADLFILSLLASAALALIWEIVQAAGNLRATQIVFGLYLFATAVLFLGVPWSKFAHMFYKPAAALQKRVEEADGSSKLPPPADVNHIVR
jgi:hypothetical protein